MIDLLPLLFALFFALAWISCIVNIIRIGLSSRRIYSVLKNEYPEIRYEYRVGSSIKTSYRTERVKKEHINSLLAFGSRQSILAYLSVFMDIGAIKEVTKPNILKRINRMIKFQQYLIWSYWGMIFSFLLAVLFNWLK